MSRFAHLPRPSFARRPGAEEKTPGGLVCRGVTRRAAMLAEARDVLGVLPGPGEALHALITGRYDLMYLLVALLGRCSARPSSATPVARRDAGAGRMGQPNGTSRRGSPMPRFDTSFNFGAAATPTSSKPPPGKQPGEAPHGVLTGRHALMCLPHVDQC
jgi:hypothetical protein